MIESKRITLVDKEDLIIDLEYSKEFAILHLPRLRMTKSSYRDFLVTVPQVCQFAQFVGYEALHTAVDPNDDTIAKLLDRLGAEFLGLDPHHGLAVYEYRGES